MKVILSLKLGFLARPAKGRPEVAELFSVSPAPRRSFACSLALSAAVHGLLIGASLKLAEHFRETGWNAVLRGYTVEPLRVMVPERLYYSRPAAKSAPRGRRLSAAKRPATAARPAPVRAPLEGPVIIQPQPQLMGLTAALRVAGVLAWTARVPEPPARDVSKPIVPGRREESAVGQIAAPPRLDIPNRELHFSDLNIAAAPPVEKPALPVEAGGTTPVEIASENKEPARPNALDAFRRDPANLLILGANSAPRNEAFTVPPGTRPGGGDPAAGQGVAARDRTSQAPEAAARPETAARADKAMPAAATPAAGLTAARPAEAHANSAGGAGDRTHPVHPVGILSPSIAGASAAPAPPPPIRRSNPGDGRFDIVILQSAPSENFAEAGAVLAGRPVYSVYLHVGTARAWVLQFCLIPVVKRPTAETAVVVLGKAERVEAPYPLSTVVPAGEPVPSARHTLFHGYLGANGRFRGLRPVSEQDLRAHNLLPYLQEWEFRPAVRESEPVDVEILLAIPPNGF